MSDMRYIRNIPEERKMLRKITLLDCNMRDVLFTKKVCCDADSSKHVLATNCLEVTRTLNKSVVNSFEQFDSPQEEQFCAQAKAKASYAKALDLDT